MPEPQPAHADFPSAFPDAAGTRAASFVPGEAWYALPPVLLIAGLWLGLLISHATMRVGQGTRLEVPGQTRFTIAVPGSYTLWDEYRTEWEGRRFDARPNLRAFDATGLAEGALPPEITPQVTDALGGMPGAVAFDRAFVTIQRLPEGTPVQQRAVLHSRENVEGTVRTTLGAYRFPAAGEYELKVWGDFPGRVFHLRKSAGVQYYLGFAAGLGLSLVGGLGAPALFLWIYLRRKQAATVPAPVTP
jgi:hypothetical protein